MSAPPVITTEALQATHEATDWLIQIAQEGVNKGTTDPLVLRWLMRLHAHCVEDLAARGKLP